MGCCGGGHRNSHGSNHVNNHGNHHENQSSQSNNANKSWLLIVAAIAIVAVVYYMI